MFLIRAALNILVRNASPRGPMCFRCLMFNLSGPCELLFQHVIEADRVMDTKKTQ